MDVFCGRTPGKQSVLRAEMYAVYGVLKSISAGRPFLLLIDNLQCCKIVDRVLSTGSVPKGIFDIAEADIVLCICEIIESCPTLSGRALWIKAHCDLEGNEKADGAAKSGAQCSPSQIEIKPSSPSSMISEELCLRFGDGSLALGAAIKKKGREKWFSNEGPMLNPQGAVALAYDSECSGQILDCGGSVCRLKFLWGRVVWDEPVFDLPAIQVCEKTYHNLYSPARFMWSL